ncbi:potassium-transporting ATPase subunit KdpC [Pararhodospirillum oryzae]|uniref:Potassium-transporting ATPase KdpC subunit n=1 Tax=Pararhodospirillum oryzae TaxID=478448 RepID=A0A512HAC2_9PROT|nr:potassium-transporting ATPase subunit KdpC [Pararhodospirillum oryzae]GEO82350.1 potassium-transporting ATPase KdpC subunit [Pararhodospirillum oryzae]
MMHDVRPTLVFLAVMTALLGFAYPLAVAGLAQVLFPFQAGGSLIQDRDKTVRGSALIAQSFTRDRYFHPRPSLAGPAGFDATASGASNLGPTDRALVDTIARRVADARAAAPGTRGKIPADLVTASASGLDPDLSPEAALWQVPRVARARGLPEDRVRQVVETLRAPPQGGLLGQPRVNVLRLNLALDALDRLPSPGAGPTAPGSGSTP